MHSAFPAILAFALFAPIARSQALPTFDAVVINPSPALAHGTDIDFDDTTFQAKNISLKRLIATAYDIRESLVSGVPGWADSAHYDINAKVIEPDLQVMRNLTNTQRAAMVAAILVDRFHLKVHTEIKTLPVYEIVVASSGPKIKPDGPDPAAPADPLGEGSGNMTVRNSEMTANHIHLPELARALSSRLDRTVIDKTNLTPRYSFALIWTPDSVATAALDTGQSADQPPIIFTAIQEQLGLKLQPAKGPVPTLIVDHIDPPTAN